MKPMELEVFPPCNPYSRAQVAWNIENGHSAYEGFHLDMHVPGLTAMRAKRLTDAQLAAEFESARCDAMLLSEAGRYYAALGDTWTKDEVSVHRRAMTLLRFATLPHYDEVPE